MIPPYEWVGYPPTWRTPGFLFMLTSRANKEYGFKILNKVIP